MIAEFNRRSFLHLGAIAGAAAMPTRTGGAIGGMIRGTEKALAVAGPDTKIIPGHGPLGARAQLQQFHDMLSAVRDKVAALKSAGAAEQEVLAKKPTAEFDPVWNKGNFSPDMFTGIVYRTV